ncbi:MAG: hypothetical protein WBF58_14335 [Xanthobacteraceae bacterium]
MLMSDRRETRTNRHLPAAAGKLRPQHHALLSADTAQARFYPRRPELHSGHRLLSDWDDGAKPRLRYHRINLPRRRQRLLLSEQRGAELLHQSAFVL